MAEKRKTWRDRKCRHGNLATTRCQYDFIHCDRPGCWDETLRRVGFVRRTPLLDFAPELLDALKETVAALEAFAHDQNSPRLVALRALIARASPMVRSLDALAKEDRNG